MKIMGLLSIRWTFTKAKIKNSSGESHYKYWPRTYYVAGKALNKKIVRNQDMFCDTLWAYTHH